MIYDGHEYHVEYNDHLGVLEVYNPDGYRIATGTLDDNVESFIFDYFSEEEGCVDGGCNSDLYYNFDVEENAKWLIATHPDNG